MPLESQVGAAATYFSSRESSTPPTTSPAMIEQLNTLLTTLSIVVFKLSVFTDHPTPQTPAVTIYNGQWNPTRRSMCDKATQSPVKPTTVSTTDLDSSDSTQASHIETGNSSPMDTEIILTFTLCSLVLESSNQLEKHMESTHSSLTCQHCDASFTSSSNLHQHISAKHPQLFPPYKQCPECMFRCQTTEQLNMHLPSQPLSHNVLHFHPK